MAETKDEMTVSDATTTAVKPTAPISGIHEPQDRVPSGALNRSNPDRLQRALERARRCARIADENRAKDILLLDIRPNTPLVDFFVIATASSRRQASAIVIEIDAEMKRVGEFKLGMEGSDEGRWALIDYGDFVVHIFSEEARTYYALEEIWGDAPQLDWRDPNDPRPRPRADQAEDGTAVA